MRGVKIRNVKVCDKIGAHAGRINKLRENYVQVWTQTERRMAKERHGQG